MDNIKIQKLTKEYVDDIYQIEKNNLGACDKDAIFSTITNDKLSYFVMLKNNSIIGFFECLILPPEIELYDIVVIESERRKGYAKLMMKYMIDLAKCNGCDTIFLEVNSINNNAINLYKNFGFEKYSERKKYYGDNDAILMKLQLK